MDKTPRPAKVSPEDYDAFIADLQQIIADAPPGYQAKYARVVSELKLKKLTRVAELRDVMHPESGDEVNYDLLLQVLADDLNDKRSSRRTRFDSAMKLAQLRGEMPPKPKPSSRHKTI